MHDEVDGYAFSMFLRGLDLAADEEPRLRALRTPEEVFELARVMETVTAGPLAEGYVSGLRIIAAQLDDEREEARSP